jgi:hypothetical protein
VCRETGRGKLAVHRNCDGDTHSSYKDASPRRLSRAKNAPKPRRSIAVTGTAGRVAPSTRPPISQSVPSSEEHTYSTYFMWRCTISMRDTNQHAYTPQPLYILFRPLSNGNRALGHQFQPTVRCRMDCFGPRFRSTFSALCTIGRRNAHIFLLKRNVPSLLFFSFCSKKPLAVIMFKRFGPTQQISKVTCVTDGKGSTQQIFCHQQYSRLLVT